MSEDFVNRATIRVGALTSFQGPQGPKGDKGETGEQGIQGIPGYTPVRGIDYWTAEDQEAINAATDRANAAAEKADITRFFAHLTGKNLFDPETVIANKTIRKSTGEIIDNDGRIVFEIDVADLQGEHIVFSRQQGANRVARTLTYGCFYDRDGAVIGSVKEAAYTFDVPEGAYTFRGSAADAVYYYEADVSKPDGYLWQCERGTEITEYVAYTKTGYKLKSEYTPASVSPNPLYGKTYLCDGDSVTAGYEDPSMSYPDQIAALNNMQLTKLAASGGTIAKGTYTSAGDPRHWICDSLDAATGAYDYVTVSGGYNDFRNDVPLGTMTTGYTDEVDTATFYGALESVCRNLVIQFTGCKCMYIITHKVAICENQNKIGLKFADYRQAIYDVCRKYGVPIMDMYTECPLAFYFDDNTVGVYTAVGGGAIHPNEHGYRTFYVPKVTAKMKEL